MSATRTNDCSRTRASLYLSFELGEGKWTLSSTVGFGRKPRQQDVLARDCVAVEHEIRRAKQRFGLPEDASVVSCYEAGRDGFWLHRYLLSVGVENLVVDSASIQVDRRKRRAKSDHLDGKQLLWMLIRWHFGEENVWSVVQVPSDENEDGRQLNRELEELRHEQTMHVNRLKGLLAGCGLTVEVKRNFSAWLKHVRMWNGKPVPPELGRRLLREFARMQHLNSQIRHLEKERSRRIREGDEDPEIALVRKLLRLKGIGPNSSWLYVKEVFGWRKIRNRRELASLVGLVPTPYNSGTQERDQGISKAGNRRMRAMAIEIAWGWLRFQHGSALSRWYDRKFAHGSKRRRKIGIVALARKLLVELWKYLQTGVPPSGAKLGDWRTKISYTPALT